MAAQTTTTATPTTRTQCRSRRGAGAPATDDGSGVWQLATATGSHSNAQARDERAFLQAIQVAPPADDDGYRAGTSVGELFHRLRRSSEPNKQGRQNVYRRVRDALLERRSIAMRTEVNGVAFLKLLVPPTNQPPAQDA